MFDLSTGCGGIRWIAPEKERQTDVPWSDLEFQTLSGSWEVIIWGFAQSCSSVLLLKKKEKEKKLLRLKLPLLKIPFQSKSFFFQSKSFF